MTVRDKNAALQRKWCEELPTVHESVDPYSGFQQCTSLKGKVSDLKRTRAFFLPSVPFGASLSAESPTGERGLLLRPLSLTAALSTRLQGNGWQLGGLGPTPTIWQTLPRGCVILYRVLTTN